MGRRDKRKGLNVGALLTLGGAVVMFFRRRSKKKAPEHKPAPTLTPEGTPRPEGGTTEPEAERSASPADPTEQPAPTGEDVAAPGRHRREAGREVPGPDADRVEEAEYESFPASDPPSWTR